MAHSDNTVQVTGDQQWECSDADQTVKLVTPNVTTDADTIPRHVLSRLGLLWDEVRDGDITSVVIRWTPGYNAYGRPAIVMEETVTRGAVVSAAACRPDEPGDDQCPF